MIAGQKPTIAARQTAVVDGVHLDFGALQFRDSPGKTESKNWRRNLVAGKARTRENAGFSISEGQRACSNRRKCDHGLRQGAWYDSILRICLLELYGYSHWIEQCAILIKSFNTYGSQTYHINIAVCRRTWSAAIMEWSNEFNSQ